MLNLYSLSTKAEGQGMSLTEEEKFCVLYHDLFDFPLNFSEMIRWLPEKSIAKGSRPISVSIKNGYCFIDGKEGAIYKRILRKRISTKKLEIARRAAGVLSLVPGVKMVAVTGSLAMENATDESDIDLMVITRKGSLWTTRLLGYWVIGLFGLKLRRPHNRDQRDALCLNMWLDESDLAWPKKDRNVYTAHEIGQILPLVNKDLSYEKFIYKNKWIHNFWPNSVKISSSKINGKWKKESGKFNLIEKIAFWLQYRHMKSKITREVVTSTRALFHPQDWGKVVLDRLHQV